MKADAKTVLILLFVLSRCKRSGGGGAAPGLGNWVPEPDPDGYNIPVVPLPRMPIPEEG